MLTVHDETLRDRRTPRRRGKTPRRRRAHRRSTGAHTVGGCKAERSCFDGEWTEKSRVFDNSYFTDLLTKTYVPETVAATGCPQHRSGAGTIMLVSDLALLEDPAFKAVVEEYAADQSLFFEEYTSAWIKLQENGVAERLRDEL